MNGVRIWKKDIAEMTGRYGVVVTTYFRWLRRLVVLNFLCFLVTYNFTHYHFYFSIYLCPVHLKKHCLLIFFACRLTVIIIPQAIEQSPETHFTHGQRMTTFRFSDLIHGEGSLKYSFLYYSGYHQRKKVHREPLKNPAIRFLLAMIIIFGINTYFIFSRISKYYRSIRMESRVTGVAHLNHFKSIMCAWDFSCGDRQASRFLHKTIQRELQVLAHAAVTETHILEIEVQLKQKRVLYFMVRKLGIFWGPLLMHMIANSFLLVCCFLLGMVLYLMCQFKLDYYINCVRERDDNVERHLEFGELCPGGDLYLQTWILSFPAVFASITTLLLTKVIVVVGDMESWSTAESKVYATMIRAGLFSLTNIAVFYSFWNSNKSLLREEGFVAETIFGKELYRLVVIQGLLDVTINIGVKGAYHFLRKRYNKKCPYKMTEFHSEYCALGMFFNHTVGVIGTLFCPGISFFVTLRMVMDFYQYKTSLLYLSSRETYAAHASTVYAPYLLTFFVSYLLTSYLNLYYMFQ